VSIPGMVGRLREVLVASTTTIGPVRGEILKVTGTTGINTINPNFGGQFGQEIRMITVDGAVTLGTTGNILIGTTTTTNKITILTYVPTLSKWAITP
jgi:hypothetical protein